MKRLALALSSFAVIGSASATVWNLASDFSLATNPNGPWTYGVMAGGSFTPANSTSPGGADWWLYNSSVCVGRFNFDGFGIESGQVSLECDYLVPAVLFTAPYSGTYDLSLAIGGRTDNYGGGHGNNNPAGGHLLVKGVERSSVSFVNNVRTWSEQGFGLATGDTVLVYIDQRYVGGNNMTKLTLSTDAVPEPASIVALGLGIAALVRRRKV